MLLFMLKTKIKKIRKKLGDKREYCSKFIVYKAILQKNIEFQNGAGVSVTINFNSYLKASLLTFETINNMHYNNKLTVRKKRFPRLKW